MCRIISLKVLINFGATMRKMGKLGSEFRKSCDLMSAYSC